MRMLEGRLGSALTFTLASMLVLGSAACGGGGRSKGSDKKIQNIFVHGDPMSILTGTTLVSISPLKTSEIATFDDFNFFGGAYFHKQSEPGTATTSEEGNEANDGSDATKIDHYKFEQTESGYVYRDTNAVDGLEFYFTDDDGILNLTEVGVGSDLTSVTPVHYSVGTATSAFSLLFKVEDPADGPGILGVHFTKNNSDTVELETLDTEYKYLLGPGIKAQWNQPITIDLCGAMSAEDEAALEKGIVGWETSTGYIGTRPLTVGRKVEYPPFTDVNSRCVQLVDGFSFEDQEDSAVYGITITTIDKTTSAIIGGNIIISNKGFEKTPGYETGDQRRMLMEYVNGHEFGHFLGLDHEFSEIAPDVPKYQSIMSYEFDNIEDETPRLHDREAIDLLYSDPMP